MELLHTNEELVTAICSGDYGAIEELYMQNRGMIRRICYSVAADRFEVEDLLQEAYLSLVKAVHNYKPELGYKFISYYTTALRGHLWRYIRYNRCKEKLDLNSQVSDDSNSEKIDLIADDKSKTTIEIIEDHELKRIILKALMKLPKEQVYVVIQHYYKGITITDLAKELNRSIRAGIYRRDTAHRTLGRDYRFRKECKEWLDDFYNAKAYLATGLSSFKRTFTSSVERCAIDRLDGIKVFVRPSADEQ